MTLLWVVLAVVVILPFVPWIWGKIIDPINIRSIRKACTEEGIEIIRIQMFPNHYGVDCVEVGQKTYRKYKMKNWKIHQVKPRQKNSQNCEQSHPANPRNAGG